jgi:uncharacterized repeat protein (TIGR03803 family)
MKVSAFDGSALGLSASILAGCGGSQPPIGMPGAMAQASALSARTNSTDYKVLYSFGTLPDGSYPTAGLIDMGGTLYGTTAGGGSNSCTYNPSSFYNGCGTVFSITTGGKEKVLYKFGPAPDGSVPRAGLVDEGGTLYGTTAYGGPYTCGYPSQPFSCGTAFSIATDGTEKVLHSFGKGFDGRYPVAGLIKMKGSFYGTTSGGGLGYCGHSSFSIRCGTVFSITPGGTEHVLYSFIAGHNAHVPLGGLIAVGGTLYGTTSRGGARGYGTVFSIGLGGGMKVLHSFGKGFDGRTPFAGLIEVKGTFYGTTAYGGKHACRSSSACGTVFSITPAGTEKVLHSFGSGTDGRAPFAGLIEAKSTLYGTTSSGGAYNQGTVFSITASGTEQVLHSFDGTDGREPWGGLIDESGTLYGTTTHGGAQNNGTVFALTP